MACLVYYSSTITKTPMKKSFSLTSTLALLPALAFGQVVIMDDSWLDGGLSNGADALDGSWHYNSNSNALELTGSGMGLVSGGSGRGIHGVFPSTSIGIGETLVLTYTFTTPATVNTLGNKTDAFRIALMNSGSTDMAQDFSASSSSPEPLLDVPLGYYTDFDVATSTDGVTLREGIAVRSTGRLLGTSTGWDFMEDGGVTAYEFLPNTTYTGTFLISLTGADALTLTSGIAGLTSHSNTDASAPVITSFDTVAFHVNSSVFGSSSNPGDPDNGIVFSNVRVEVIPEPTTYAVLFGALALGIVAFRRRK